MIPSFSVIDPIKRAPLDEEALFFDACFSPYLAMTKARQL